MNEIKKRAKISPLRLNQKLLKLLCGYKQAILTKIIAMFNVVINPNVLQGNLLRTAVETHSLKSHSTRFHDSFRHWLL